MVKVANVNVRVFNSCHPPCEEKKRRVRVVLLHTTNILTNIHTDILTNIHTYKHTTNIQKRMGGPRQAYRPGGSGAGLWGAADSLQSAYAGKAYSGYT